MGCTIDSNFFMLLCFSVCTQQHTQFRHLSRTVRPLAGRLPPRTHGDWLLHRFTLSLSQEGRLDLMLSLEIGFAWRRRLTLLQTVLYEKLSSKEAIREPRIFFLKSVFIDNRECTLFSTSSSCICCIATLSTFVFKESSFLTITYIVAWDIINTLGTSYSAYNILLS